MIHKLKKQQWGDNKKKLGQIFSIWWQSQHHQIEVSVEKKHFWWWLQPTIFAFSQAQASRGGTDVETNTWKHPLLGMFSHNIWEVWSGNDLGFRSEKCIGYHQSQVYLKWKSGGATNIQSRSPRSERTGRG